MLATGTCFHVSTIAYDFSKVDFPVNKGEGMIFWLRKKSEKTVEIENPVKNPVPEWTVEISKDIEYGAIWNYVITDHHGKVVARDYVACAGSKKDVDEKIKKIVTVLKAKAGLIPDTSKRTIKV